MTTCQNAASPAGALTYTLTEVGQADYNFPHTASYPSMRPLLAALEYGPLTAAELYYSLRMTLNPALLYNLDDDIKAAVAYGLIAPVEPKRCAMFCV